MLQVNAPRHARVSNFFAGDYWGTWLVGSIILFVGNLIWLIGDASSADHIVEWYQILILGGLLAFGVGIMTEPEGKYHLRDGSTSIKATKVYNGLSKDHKALAESVLLKIYALDKEDWTPEIEKAMGDRLDMLKKLQKREVQQRMNVVVDDSDTLALESYLNEDSLRAIDSPRRV